MIKGKNFQKTLIGDIPKDSEYQKCNFSRQNCIDDAGQKKGVRLFPGDDTSRIFIECNLVNCEPPPGSTVIDCNTAIRENTIEVGSENIEIDGDIIEAKEYVNMIYGRYHNGQYVYKASPVQVPCEAPEVK